MIVGVIGPQGPDDFADNINDSLTAMGIQNVRLGPTEIRSRSGKAAAGLRMAHKYVHFDDIVQRRLLRRIMDSECSVVLTVDGNTSPTLVQQVRARGIPMALWFPDPVSNFGRGRMLLAPYSHLFYKEPRIVERLKATLGLPAHYLPEACNERWHRSSELQGVDPFVVVAGGINSSRLVLLSRLIKAGIPIALYGDGFPRWVGDHPAREFDSGRYIVRAEKADIFRRAAAVLNQLRLGEIEGVNCRLFEAAGSGAVVLAESRSTIPQLFARDELLIWNDFDELVDQARTALAASGSLAPMGDRAASRAHSEHTYAHRLNVILEMMV